MKKTKLLIPILTAATLVPAVTIPLVACGNNKDTTSKLTLIFTSTEGGTLEGEKSLSIDKNTQWKDVIKPITKPKVDYYFAGWFSNGQELKETDKLTTNMAIIGVFKTNISKDWWDHSPFLPVHKLGPTAKQFEWGATNEEAAKAYLDAIATDGQHFVDDCHYFTNRKVSELYSKWGIDLRTNVKNFKIDKETNRASFETGFKSTQIVEDTSGNKHGGVYEILVKVNNIKLTMEYSSNAEAFVFGSDEEFLISDDQWSIEAFGIGKGYTFSEEHNEVKLTGKTITYNKDKLADEKNWTDEESFIYDDLLGELLPQIEHNKTLGVIGGLSSFYMSDFVPTIYVKPALLAGDLEIEHDETTGYTATDDGQFIINPEYKDKITDITGYTDEQNFDSDVLFDQEAKHCIQYKIASDNTLTATFNLDIAAKPTKYNYVQIFRIDFEITLKDESKVAKSSIRYSKKNPLNCSFKV